MQVVGIVGPDDEVATVEQSLVAALAENGQVATVHSDGNLDEPGDGDGNVAETHRLDADGAWQGNARDRDLDAVLADLAPRVEFAALVGFPEADVPTVALDGVDHEGETLVAPPDSAALDADEVAGAVAETEPLETLHSLVATAKAAQGAEYSGAVATFTGRVRARENESDVRTEHLEFEKYDGVAEEKMEGIRADIEARDGVYDVELYHKSGVVPAGEDVVHVVVLAGHRAEAFAAVEDGINRLKAEVPLFKKEVTVDDAFWAHQRE